MISLPYDNIESIGYYNNGYHPYTNGEIEIVSLVSEGDNSHGYVYNTLPILQSGSYEYNILSSEVEWRGKGKVELEINAENFSVNNLVSIVITDNNFARYVDSSTTNNRQFIVNINPQKIGIVLKWIGLDNQYESMGGFSNDLSLFTDDRMYYGYKCLLYDRETGTELCLKYTNNRYSEYLYTDMCISTKEGFRQFLFYDNYAVNFVSDYYNENAWSRTDRGHIQSYIIDNTTYMNGLSGSFEVIRESGSGYVNRFDYTDDLQYKIIFSGKDNYYSGNICIEHVYTKNMVLKMLACFGLYVKINNVEYMPEILNDRCCTGRLIPPAEQATTDSLIKELSDSQPTIITPVKPEGNDMENIGLNSNYGQGRFVRWYGLSLADIYGLESWLNGEQPSGYKPLDNFICLSEYMFNIFDEGICSPVPERNIKIGTETYSATWNRIYDISRVIDLGSYKINSYNNDFTDYAPYSSYRVYIPYCNWVDLDSDVVVGEEINVKLIVDPLTTACKGIVLVKGNIIAEVNGTCGNSVPLSSANMGVLKQALLNTGVTLGSSALAITGGLATGNPLAIGGGVVGAIGGITQGLANMHKSINEVKGTTGTSTNYNTYGSCVIQITHPIERISDSYAHTIGYITNKTKSIENCVGFVKCENVDTSGLTCDYAERQEIKAILESGFYC